MSKPHPRAPTPHKSHCQKKVIIQDSQSDSSLELDNDSDSLNYYSPLPVGLETQMNKEGNHWPTIAL